MNKRKRVVLILPLLTATLMISGCEELTRNTESLLLPEFRRSDVFGFVAGLGTIRYSGEIIHS